MRLAGVYVFLAGGTAEWPTMYMYMYIENLDLVIIGFINTYQNPPGIPLTFKTENIHRL